MRQVPRARATAESLRREFDRSFAEARPPAIAPPLDFLAIRVGGERYALPLAELLGLHADAVITPVPGPLAALCGVACLGGAILPVHDLRLLLGGEGGASPRWLVRVAGAPAVALGFDGLEGHLRIHTALAGVVPQAGGGLRILDIASIVADIARRVESLGPRKERRA